MKFDSLPPHLTDRMKKKKYLVASAGQDEWVEFRTPSLSLLQYLIDTYCEVIFPDRIYNSVSLSESHYVIKDFSWSMLEPILRDSNDEYEVWMHQGNHKWLVRACDGEKEWLAA